MALQTTTYRTPAELAADLAELSTVDWRRVWAGYAQANPLTWCAQFGWRLDRLNRVEDATVRIGSGGSLYLAQATGTGGPLPVTSASQVCWRSEVQAPDENPALFTAAETIWSDYVTRASDAVGAPTATSSDDVTDRPEIAGLRPHRLALWTFDGATALFYIAPSTNATTTDRLGGIQIKLLLRPSGRAA